MTNKLSPVMTILAVSIPALGYGLNGLWSGTVLAVTVGALWLLGQRRGWAWMASAALVLLVGMATVGLWLRMGSGWGLAGTVAALSAWDLDRFAQRMRAAGRVENERELERRHLQRLLVAAGAGLLMGTIASSIKLPLGFGTALLLALAAILGLSRMIGLLRREEDRKSATSPGEQSIE